MLTPDELWKKICANEGQTFVQIRSGRFRYKVEGNTVILDRTNQRIPRSEFEKALQRWPFENTVPLQDLRAPSYVFAISTVLLRDRS